jgi:hypothetical protein
MPPGAAEVFEDQVNLAPGESVEVRIDHNTSDLGVVVYLMTVLNGPPVNVWLVPEEGREQYHDPAVSEFQHYADRSRKDVSEVIDLNVELEEPGVYYVIIDNPTSTTDGEVAVVYYRVQYDLEPTGLSSTQVNAIIITVVAALVFIVLFNIVARRTEARRELKDDEDSRVVKQMIKKVGGHPPPPRPPQTYSEEVVKGSMEDLGHDGEGPWEE